MKMKVTALVGHAPPGAHPNQRQALAEELAKLIGPDESAIVLPHGWRLEVVQPVEVP